MSSKLFDVKVFGRSHHPEPWALIHQANLYYDELESLRATAKHHYREYSELMIEATALTISKEETFQ